MTDSEFLLALENLSLPSSAFGHAGHVRACYLYLSSRDFGAALECIRTAIRTYAAFLGKPERYDDAMTVAYVGLIRQRMDERGEGADWPTFAACNPDLVKSDALLRSSR